MKYTLWDTETSNLFGQFEDEHEALILVRTLVGHYGASYADELALGRMTNEGTILEPLTGVPLMARADEVLGDCGQGIIDEARPTLVFVGPQLPMCRSDIATIEHIMRPGSDNSRSGPR